MVITLFHSLQTVKVQQRETCSRQGKTSAPSETISQIICLPTSAISRSMSYELWARRIPATNRQTRRELVKATAAPAGVALRLLWGGPRHIAWLAAENGLSRSL